MQPSGQRPDRMEAIRARLTEKVEECVTEREVERERLLEEMRPPVNWNRVARKCLVCAMLGTVLIATGYIVYAFIQYRPFIF